MKKLCAFVIALTFLSLTGTVSLYAKKKDILIALEATDTIKGSSSFNQVQVIDARKDKSNLGRSFTNGKRMINTHDSLAANVQQLVQSMLHGVEQPTNRQLLIVVHNLQLQDVVLEQRLISTLLIDMDFYFGSAGQYTHISRLDSLYEMHLGRNQVQMLLSVTNYLLTEKIKELATIQDVPATPARSLTHILTKEEELKRGIPVYHQPARKGVYNTYEQFRNNTPADTAIYHDHYLAGDTHVDRFYLSSAQKKKDKDLAYANCFAIYNGEKWYKRYTENTFKEMKLTDGDFFYYDIARGLKLEDYSSVGFVGAPYGILASLVTTGIAKALNEHETSKPPVYDDALFRMKLDPETGEGKKLERIR